jgi:Flp pilus assembly protein TadD
MTDQKSERELREDLARNFGLTRAKAEDFYRRALDAFDAGDMDNAIIDVSEALYYDPGYAEFYATRGYFYAQDLKRAEAEADLRYAIKLNKREWLAHYTLGLLAFQAGDYQEAYAHLQTAGQYAPRRVEVAWYRAVAAWYTHRDDQARQDIELALSLMPDDDKRRKEAQGWLREFGGKLSADTSKDAKEDKALKKTGEAKQITSGKKK